jgi:hypothetical protein
MIFAMNDETIDACETCKEYKAIVIHQNRMENYLMKKEKKNSNIPWESFCTSKDRKSKD